jgi:hypothetical protein
MVDEIENRAREFVDVDCAGAPTPASVAAFSRSETLRVLKLLRGEVGELLDADGHTPDYYFALHEADALIDKAIEGVG